MSRDLLLCAALDLRDEQRRWVRDEIGEFVEGLCLRVNARIDEMSKWDLVKSRLPTPSRSRDEGDGDADSFHTSDIAPIIEAAFGQQMRRICSRLQEQAMEDIRLHTPEIEDDVDLEELLGLASGMVLSVAPFAALPFIVGAALTTTTTLFVVSTTTVSVPVIAIGAAGVAAASVAGFKLKGMAFEKIRDRYKTRVRRMIEARAMEDPKRREAQTLLSWANDLIDGIALMRPEAG